jgi:hypothetical protein
VLALYEKGKIMKRKSLAALTAAVPAVALAATVGLASPPHASAATLPTSPARSVQSNLERDGYVIIIVTTGVVDGSTGMKSATPTAAAKQLDS